MAIYEVTPGFNPKAKNRHRVLIGVESDDSGEETFLKGDALIAPPVQLTEKYLQHIKTATGLIVSETLRSEEGTLFEFRVDMSDTSIQGSARERAEDGFRTILTEIGFTATAIFRQNHQPDNSNPDKVA